MARSGLSVTLLIAALAAASAEGAISPSAQFIVNRDYRRFSTANPLGTIEAKDIDKASGIVPTVSSGLVAWADGRSGTVEIVGRFINDYDAGEFLLSDATDLYQAGNPFVGVDAGGGRRIVYDAAEVGVSFGDFGEIAREGVTKNSTKFLVKRAMLQRSPVFVTSGGQETLAWIHDPQTGSQFNGETNTDIYTAPMVGTPPYAVGTHTNITPNDAPREHLAGDGDYLVWQEMRMHNPIFETSSWDIAVYDLSTGGTQYINGPGVNRNQIRPGVANELMVWMQEEDPAGTGATNIYLQDLASNIGPIALTTHGMAANPAISHTFVNEGGSMVETYFVVWQQYFGQPNDVFYAGGNGQYDKAWDLWGQEIRYDAGAGRWEPYLDPFEIVSDVGRQTNIDIDGLDITWQSQDPGVEDIYVWAPVPEPATMSLLLGGAGVLLLRRRARRTA